MDEVLGLQLFDAIKMRMALRKHGQKKSTLTEAKDLVRVNDYEVREGLYYSEDYLWLRIEDASVRIGIIDYAQKQLHEIVYVELLSAGDTIKQNTPLGTVESAKSVTDLVAPVSGTIEQINEEVVDRPELINDDPYGKGWLVIVSPTNLDEELKRLMPDKRAVEWHKKLT
ncbi:MAG: glycine cleavage system H protein [Candidatus Atabeyarchaeum deiterrae]